MPGILIGLRIAATGGGGFPIATPSLVYVEPVTNPPDFDIDIVTIGTKAVAEDDVVILEITDSEDAVTTLTSGALTAGDITAGEITFDSAGTFAAGVASARARVRRGSDPYTYSAWSSSVSDTLPSTAITQQQIIDLSPYAFWSLGDLSDVWKESTRSTNVSADEDGIGAIDDISGNARHMLQNNSSHEPEYDETGGIRSFITSGSDLTDYLEVTSVTPPNDCSIFFQCKTSDTAASLLTGHSGSHYAAVMQDGSSSAISSNAGSPTVYVDGTLVSPNTRDGLHTAIADGSWHVVEIRGVDLSAWTAIRSVGMYTSSGFSMDGNAGPDLIIIPTSAFDSDDRDNTIIPYLQQGVGL